MSVKLQNKQKSNLTQKEIRFVVTRRWGGGRGNWMKAVKRYQLPVIRQINTREVIYMINRMNTSVCYT